MHNKYSYNLIKWSFRKFFLPIKKNDLVLDIGSGSNPHPRANILLEKFVDNKHRYSNLVADRPIVIADAMNTPFKSKIFDFTICFHVLEHINNPNQFLLELQRISKAGYIETPNAIFERINPYDVHVLEIINLNNKLFIHKKNSARPDNYFNQIELIKNSRTWNKFFYNNPEMFHVRYLWKDNINYEIENDDLDIEWTNDEKLIVKSSKDILEYDESINNKNLRSYVLNFWNKYNRTTKKTKINIDDILVCPYCHSDLQKENNFYICIHCRLKFPINPFPNFINFEKL